MKSACSERQDGWLALSVCLPGESHVFFFFLGGGRGSGEFVLFLAQEWGRRAKNLLFFREASPVFAAQGGDLVGQNRRIWAPFW